MKLLKHIRHLSFSRTAAWLAFFTAPISARAEAWQDYPVDWKKSGQSIIDLSAHLPRPAGAQGFIYRDGAQLRRPDGQRFRIWGVNIHFSILHLPKEEMERFADDLARWGINAARLHHVDVDWGGAIFGQGTDTTQKLDAAVLDRICYLIQALKKRGIYTTLNLNVFRVYRPADGVRDHEKLGVGKAATYFNPRLIELQKDFARQFLTHFNPYTKLEIRHDPAILSIEIVNENSLLEGTVNWRLVGKEDKPEWHDPAWCPLPVSYSRELDALYQKWLAESLSTQELEQLRRDAQVAADQPVPRGNPIDLLHMPLARFRHEVKFYQSLERKFFDEMRHYLRDQLGCASLIVGTASHNRSFPDYTHVEAQSSLDLVDGHNYWQHPSIGNITRVENTPMVNSPQNNPLVHFARIAREGYPLTISEINHAFPHRFSAEMAMMTTAYALLNDYDGIYWFDFGQGWVNGAVSGMGKNSWFDTSNDPVKVSTLAAAALMWHRGDVAVAKKTWPRTMTAMDLVDTLRLDRDKELPLFTPELNPVLPLIHRTRWQLAKGSGPRHIEKFAFPTLDAISSDTEQLHWRHAPSQKGLISISTPRTHALIGHVGAQADETPHLRERLGHHFASVSLSSLTDQPLSQCDQMLLTVATEMQNTEQRWEADGKTLANWGHGPTQFLPPSGDITLKSLSTARSLKIQPLNGIGAPQGAPVEITATGGEVVIDFSKIEPAIWYHLQITR